MIEDLIAHEAQASEQHKDAPIRPHSKLSRGHARTQTLQVRMNAEELETLTDLAQALGVPTSTLARDLLLGHLAAAQVDTPRTVLARMRADLDALAATVS